MKPNGFRSSGKAFAGMGLESGVDVTEYEALVRSGELERLAIGSLQRSGRVHIGESAFPAEEQEQSWPLLTDDSGATVSGSETGCEQMGETEVTGLLVSKTGEFTFGLTSSPTNGSENCKSGDLTKAGV